jgi:hypothetical protein
MGVMARAETPSQDFWSHRSPAFFSDLAGGSSSTFSSSSSTLSKTLRSEAISRNGNEEWQRGMAMLNKSEILVNKMVFREKNRPSVKKEVILHAVNVIC